MSEARQNELLPAVDPGELQQLLDQAPSIDPRAWPKTLTELLDVFAAYYVRNGRSPDDARGEARAIVLILANHFGGRMVYLPRDERLRKALRDAAIWAEFNGRNPEALALKYELTVMQIYNILREQRTLHRRRNEPDLF